MKGLCPSEVQQQNTDIEVRMVYSECIKRRRLSCVRSSDGAEAERKTIIVHSIICLYISIGQIVCSCKHGHLSAGAILFVAFHVITRHHQFSETMAVVDCTTRAKKKSRPGWV